jgi:RNA polymerase subunit RPABC4/transcription elongation factor Spt4
LAKKECPGCAIEVDRSEKICPICSYEFPEQPKSLKIMAWLMAILLILWLIF